MSDSFFEDKSLVQVVEIIEGLARGGLLPSSEVFVRLLQLEQQGEDVESKLCDIVSVPVLYLYRKFKNPPEETEEGQDVDRCPQTAPSNDPVFGFSEDPSFIAILKREPEELPEGEVDPEKLKRELVARRTHFFLTCYRPQDDDGERRRKALNDLNRVRNTVAGQAFLARRPFFLENVDRELIQVLAEKKRNSSRL